jgi:hypothetical protein
MTCEYCDDEKTIADGDHCSAYIKRDCFNGGYVLVAYEREFYSEATGRINYCPMCGRDLRGDAE